MLSRCQGCPWHGTGRNGQVDRQPNLQTSTIVNEVPSGNCIMRDGYRKNIISHYSCDVGFSTSTEIHNYRDGREAIDSHHMYIQNTRGEEGGRCGGSRQQTSPQPHITNVDMISPNDQLQIRSLIYTTTHQRRNSPSHRAINLAPLLMSPYVYGTASCVERG